MHKNLLPCRKFNFCVPQTYGDCRAYLSTSQSSKGDLLKIYTDEGFNDDLKIEDLSKLVKSSIPVSEIKSFMFGPFSTRFWMMRMGVNQTIIENNQYNRNVEVPFLAWECITLYT